MPSSSRFVAFGGPRHFTLPTNNRPHATGQKSLHLAPPTRSIKESSLPATQLSQSTHANVHGPAARTHGCRLRHTLATFLFPRGVGRLSFADQSDVQYSPNNPLHLSSFCAYRGQRATSPAHAGQRTIRRGPIQNVQGCFGRAKPEVPRVPLVGTLRPALSLTRLIGRMQSPDFTNGGRVASRKNSFDR